MKGIIFNIAEGFIIENYGEDVYEDILAGCKLQTEDPFVGPGTYPDSDFLEVVKKSTEKLNISTDIFLENLGEYAFGQLAERVPEFVTPYSEAKPFLKTVHGIIHVEVRKLYQGTKLPAFQYQEPNENELIITYYSERKLYPLMAGLIQGVARHFDTIIEQQQRVFEKDGSEFCDFHLKFSK